MLWSEKIYTLNFWSKCCVQNDFNYLKIININQVCSSIIDYYAFNTLSFEKLYIKHSLRWNKAFWFVHISFLFQFFLKNIVHTFV
jgi:hypothetical protein